MSRNGLADIAGSDEGALDQTVMNAATGDGVSTQVCATPGTPKYTRVHLIEAMFQPWS